MKWNNENKEPNLTKIKWQRGNAKLDGMTMTIIVVVVGFAAFLVGYDIWYNLHNGLW